MQIDLEAGHYIVAVSGGVDSVVLLHLLHDLSGVHLTVAHYDHGIRDDSIEDAALVRRMARRYGVPFVYDKGELGPAVSESLARERRYEFLHAVRDAAGASAVITAHHQDDVLETAIHNMVRGTGRRGLSSLRSTDTVRRPLLHIPKAAIVRYAERHNLEWREDSTNATDDYTRNYIRHHIMTRFSAEDRERLWGHIQAAHGQNDEIDGLVGTVLTGMRDSRGLRRDRFIGLPHAVAREVMASWLREQGISDIDSKLLERLVRGAKVLRPGTQVHATQKRSLIVEKTYLALRAIER